MVVAIDGPAGSGKSTVAHLIADRLGFTFLNSGSFYRAITLALIEAGIDMANEDAVVAFARTLSLEYQNSRLILNGVDVEDRLHTDAVDDHAAQVSAFVPVRRIVNEKIRLAVENMNIVCEGRDMTTVVFPNAESKFYLDATADARARRRFEQQKTRLSLNEIRESIEKRDNIDKNKPEGSLKRAPDAFYLDTSDLTIKEVCEILISKIQALRV